MTVSINVMHGNSEVRDDDIYRAQDAAAAVFAMQSADEDECFAEFKRQWEALDSYDGMTGLAAIWVEAERAADRALTKGWADTSGASCSISA